MIQLKEILSLYASISLEEMDDVNLMDRIDTKYISTISQVHNVLNEARDKYKMLEINGIRDMGYRTIYYDTDDLCMYTCHQNRKLNRYKIRLREYLINGVKYLEVKFKSNKKKTIKKRIKIRSLDFSQEGSSHFVNTNSPYIPTELRPKLFSEFTRLTLVSKSSVERITIDINLKFQNADNKNAELSNLSIIEIKREKVAGNSDFARILRNNGIKPHGISKYCIGLLLTSDKIKYNRFKPLLRIINKLSYGNTYQLPYTNN